MLATRVYRKRIGTSVLSESPRSLKLSGVRCVARDVPDRSLGGTPAIPSLPWSPTVRCCQVPPDSLAKLSAVAISTRDSRRPDLLARRVLRVVSLLRSNRVACCPSRGRTKVRQRSYAGASDVLLESAAVLGVRHGILPSSNCGVMPTCVLTWLWRTLTQNFRDLGATTFFNAISSMLPSPVVVLPTVASRKFAFVLVNLRRTLQGRGCQDFRVQGGWNNYTEGRTNRSA